MKKGWFSKLLSSLNITTIEPIDPQEMNEIKSLLKNAFVVFKKYQVSLEDDVTTATEWLGIVKSATPLIGNIKNWKIIKEQLLNFKFEDGKELILFVIEQGVIPKEAETVVKHLVDYIEIQIMGYNNHVKPIIDIIKK
jgi:hypothetical protein